MPPATHRATDQEIATADLETLQSLRRAIQRADGFCLLIAVCNSPAYRYRLIEHLGHLLARPLRIVEVVSDCPDVLEQLTADPDQPAASPVAVTDLETGIRSSDPGHPRIAALNHRREEWRERVAAPVVLWVPEYLLRPLAAEAPDFLDWRSGTFLFLPPVSATTTTTPLTGIDTSETWRLTQSDREERIEQLQQLIRTYSQPTHENDEAVHRWQLELSELQYYSGEWDDALATTRTLLQNAQPEQEAIRAEAWGQIADILQSRGDLDEALRIRREEELPVYERLGDVRSLLVGRANLAVLLVERGQPGDRDEARRLLEWALDAAEKMGLPEAEKIRGILRDVGGDG